ncbi:unnamed protein product [Sympodiomycopsis kandeliae]
MSPDIASSQKLRILLVNDDGPPGPSSPHIFGLYKTLISRGHSVTVVIPSSQKSWGAMAFSISGNLGVWWYYPLSDSDGRKGEWSTQRRALKDGEEAEWVLVDGSPTTCANIGLFNQSFYQSGGGSKPFDLVLSGPNLGRNTGQAFCLSSGTLGAALSASLSNVKSIALSYGHFATVPGSVQKSIDASEIALKASQAYVSKEEDQKTVAPRELVEVAHQLSVDIVERLYEKWESNVGTYGINVPLAWTLKDPKIYWTTTWRNSYPQLFKPVSQDKKGAPTTHLPSHAPQPESHLTFSPEMTSMMAPQDDSIIGTDTWAIVHGHVSITRVRPGFAEVPLAVSDAGESRKVDTENVERRRFRL